MDFKKTGQFIQNRRKEKGLTQKQLAETLAISDKTVSKWETGGGMPDVTLISQLCQILEINVNELLSGETLSSKDYPEKAEVNMISLMKKNRHGKKRDVLRISVGAILLVCAMLFVLQEDIRDCGRHLPVWLYEPYAFLAEGLSLSAFLLISVGMETKERFRLAERFILATGVVFSLCPLVLTLMRMGTEEIANLDPYIAAVCLFPILYAFCIRIVLIFAEIIRERASRGRLVKKAE